MSESDHEPCYRIAGAWERRAVEEVETQTAKPAGSAPERVRDLFGPETSARFLRDRGPLFDGARFDPEKGIDLREKR